MAGDVEHRRSDLLGHRGGQTEVQATPLLARERATEGCGEQRMIEPVAVELDVAHAGLVGLEQQILGLFS